MSREEPPSPGRVNAPPNSSWVSLPAASAQEGLRLGKFLQAAAPATFPHSRALASPGTLPPSCCPRERPLSPQRLHKAPFFGGAKETPQCHGEMVAQKGRKKPKTPVFAPAPQCGADSLHPHSLGLVMVPQGWEGHPHTQGPLREAAPLGLDLRFKIWGVWHRFGLKIRGFAD